MTFTKQVRAVRGLLTLLAGMATAAVALSVLNQQWVTLTVLVPGIAAFGWLLHMQWRLTGRQSGLGDLADQLRQVSRSVPAGMDRLYTSVLTTTAVHVHPNTGSGFDQFSQFDTGDMDGLGHVESGDTVNLPAITYRVRRSFPLVWRHIWADRAIKTSMHGQYVTLPQPATNYRDVVRLFLLNHRTGVLVPDRAELDGLLHAMQNADHIRDIPRKTK